MAQAGFAAVEITTNPPAITDKQAQSYGNDNVRFRYLAATTITVYSRSVDAVRQAREQLLQLGKSGIAISSNNYDPQTQFLFEGLNAIKKVRVVSTLEFYLAD